MKRISKDEKKNLRIITFITFKPDNPLTRTEHRQMDLLSTTEDFETQTEKE